MSFISLENAGALFVWIMFVFHCLLFPFEILFLYRCLLHYSLCLRLSVLYFPFYFSLFCSGSFFVYFSLLIFSSALSVIFFQFWFPFLSFCNFQLSAKISNLLIYFLEYLRSSQRLCLITLLLITILHLVFLLAIFEWRKNLRSKIITWSWSTFLQGPFFLSSFLEYRSFKNILEYRSF